MHLIYNLVYFLQCCFPSYYTHHQDSNPKAFSRFKDRLLYLQLDSSKNLKFRLLFFDVVILEGECHICRNFKWTIWLW